MKRYDMNNACDGESGECRAEMIPTVYGDYVLFDDIADDARDAALWREHGARLMEALDVAIHRLHYVVDPFTGDSNDNSGLHATLAAAREAAGKEKR